METIEEVREFFMKDRFAMENGAVIEEIGEHYAKCSIALTDRHRNALGAVMGGVHFMLADFAFAVAANWQQVGVVSLNSSIAYLGAVRGEKLIATAKSLKEGRNTNFYEISLEDELGSQVAVVSTTGFRKG